MTGGPGYIRSGDDVPYREPGSRDPEEALALLLGLGANPNAKAPDGSTLLHQAVRTGDLEIIQALADSGVDFNQPNDDDLTALDIAEGRRPEGEEQAEPDGGGRGGRGGRTPPPEVAARLRELMGLPPAPVEESPPQSPTLPEPGVEE